MPQYNIPKLARNRYNYVKGADGNNYVTVSQMMMSTGSGSGGGGGTGGGTSHNQIVSAVNEVLADRGLPTGYDIVSSYDLKTINGYSLVGYGDIEVSGSGTVDLSAYATKTYVADYVNTYAPEPDLSAYATKTYVADYVDTYGGNVDLSAYATKTYVTDYVSTYAPEPDLSAYATKTYVADYVDAYAPTPDLSAYATKTYVADYVSTYAPEPDLSAYATKTYVVDYVGAYSGTQVVEITQEQYDQLSQTEKTNGNIYVISDAPDLDMSYYVTKTELSNAGYVTSTSLDTTLNSYATKSELNDYATKSYVAEYVYTYAKTPDLSSYVTKTELSNAGYVTSTSLDTTLNSYATKSELNDYATKTDITQASYLETTGGDITGQLYIGYNAPSNASYSLNTYSHIVAGTRDKTTVSLIGTKRKCSNESYMSAFFTNSDGRSKFTHKAQGANADPGSGADDAFLCFNAYGFKLAYSGVSGTGATTEYDLVHTGNINSFGFITYVSFDTSTYTLTISI